MQKIYHYQLQGKEFLTTLKIMKEPSRTFYPKRFRLGPYSRGANSKIFMGAYPRGGGVNKL